MIGGLGISVLSRHTLELDTPSNQFVILDVRGFPIKRHWYFAYPAGKQLSIIARTFIDHLRQASNAKLDVAQAPKAEAKKNGKKAGPAKRK